MTQRNGRVAVILLELEQLLKAFFPLFLVVDDPLKANLVQLGDSLRSLVGLDSSTHLNLTIHRSLVVRPSSENVVWIGSVRNAAMSSFSFEFDQILLCS